MKIRLTKQQLKQKKQSILKVLQQNCLYTIGSNASESMQITQDAKILSERIIMFMYKKHPDIDYKDFYDKKFLDLIKSVIKDQIKFKQFLKIINYHLDDFLHIAVYVCPQAFTSSIIKYIRDMYLEND